MTDAPFPLSGSKDRLYDIERNRLFLERKVLGPNLAKGLVSK